MLTLLFLMAVSLQVIQVNQTTPCFMNFSAGPDIWRNCGMGEDYLESVLLGWEWVTGGYFSMIMVSIFVMMSYVKYHKAIYPIVIGILFMPVSYFLFPDTFLTVAIIMAAITIGILIFYAFTRQTKEF